MTCVRLECMTGPPPYGRFATCARGLVVRCPPVGMSATTPPNDLPAALDARPIIMTSAMMTPAARRRRSPVIAVERSLRGQPVRPDAGFDRERWVHVKRPGHLLAGD